MSWYNLRGLNPNFKEFLEKHPKKTILGIEWTMYWRFMVIVLVFEAIFFGIFFIFASLVS